MSDVDIALWPDVDQAADTAAMISFLDTARTLPGLRIAKAEVVAALRLRAGQRVLDVGSGTGEDALEMARRVAPGGSVVGVEPSDAMRAEAIRRAVVYGLPVVFQAGDAAALPLDDHSVDAARADTVLQHLSDPAARSESWCGSPGRAGGWRSWISTRARSWSTTATGPPRPRCTPT